MALLCLFVFFESSHWGSKLRFFANDFLYQNFNRETKASEEVVVIDIDDQSLNILGPSYGRWPWPRRVYKEMLEFISMGSPRMVLFDITFGESQKEDSASKSDDEELAAISKNLGNVSHAMELLPDARFESSEAFPAELKARFAVDIYFINAEARETYKKNSAVYKDFALPLPRFSSELPLLHVVSVRPDADGIFRQIPLFSFFGDTAFPSLSLRALLGTTNLKLKYSGQAISFDKFKIPLNDQGKLNINYYNDAFRPKSIPIAPLLGSAKKIQEGSVSDPSELAVNPEEFKNKIVLVGASAVGLEDLKPTPVHPNYPGVLLHATAISNILENDYTTSLYRPLLYILLLAMLILIYGCIFFMPHMGAKIFVPLGALFAFNGLAFALFKYKGVFINFAAIDVTTFLAVLDGFIYVSFVEGREKKRFQETLSKYLSPEVTKALIQSGQDPRAEVGKREELSILFSDIRGFTKLSEKNAPEYIVGLLNEYLARMTEIVFDSRGTLDKFIGDAVMAFWGAPVKDADHAARSVRCALEMHTALRRLNESWAAKGIGFEMGIGINSGDVIVGNIGSEKRLDYTVIGDNVNLASRLEGLTKYYGVPIILGPRTFELLAQSATGSKIVCRLIDKVAVVGKDQPVSIYEPLGDGESAQAKASAFGEAWKSYSEGDFSKAAQLFEKLGADKLARLYVERCEKFKKNPPATPWDAVYKAESK